MGWKRLKNAAVAAIATLLIFAAVALPVNAEGPWTHGELFVSPETVCAGESALISGNGAPPGETLSLIMEPNGIVWANEGTSGGPTHSYVLNLGATKVDADGKWTLETKIPPEAAAIMRGMPPGAVVPGEWIVLVDSETHFAFNTITVRDCSGSLLPIPMPSPDQPITPSLPAAATQAGSTTSTLPSTGFTIPPALLALAGLLASAGLLKTFKWYEQQ